MQPIMKTLLMLTLAAAPALSIGAAQARPPGGGGVTQPPGPWVPPSFDVWYCEYGSPDFGTFTIEKDAGFECESSYFGAKLGRSWLAPPSL